MDESQVFWSAQTKNPNDRQIAFNMIRLGFGGPEGMHYWDGDGDGSGSVKRRLDEVSTDPARQRRVLQVGQHSTLALLHSAPTPSLIPFPPSLFPSSTPALHGMVRWRINRSASLIVTLTRCPAEPFV